MVDVDSMTGGFAEKLPDTDDFYPRIVSSDEEDFSDPDDGFLYPAGTGYLKGGSVDGRRLDHWCTVVWDPGIMGSRAQSVCDCLCSGL